MKSSILALMAIASAILLSSCHPFETPEIREPKKIRAQVLRFVGNQPIVRMEAHCYNQNALGFTYEGGEFDLFLDTLFLGHAVIDTSFPVNAHAPFTVPFQLRLDAVRLGAHGLDLSKEVRVRVDGSMWGSTLGISKTLPVHYTGRHLIDLRMNYPVN